ncbi:hypothetical protein [Anatilimnocola floriformis]|uniref:hypothetical protein n=1 Tax=Anatilimnocola floriformis TaxID=2948575 RepID=UPI0020C31076|nr:hypothetical protein [Anatilimnocola floriformis]
MISHKQLAAACGIFGLAVIAGGVIRILMDANGQNGLYFGLAMGSIALMAATFAFIGQIWPARIVAALAIFVVVLWFGYDMYRDLKNNFRIGEAEIRKSVVIALGVALAVILALPVKKAN